MFTLSARSLDDHAALRRVPDPAVGGVVVFVGRVRDHNEGKRVTALEYEVYEELALAEGARIVAECRARFPVEHVECVHRQGRLAVGDIAVITLAAARHRGAAFDACRYLIDQLKDRVPIWKKEHYVDHPSAWVACHRCAGEGPAPDHDQGHG